jgi:superfamily II DNA or RNA helicase
MGANPIHLGYSSQVYRMSTAHRILTSRGYSVLKERLAPEEVAFLKAELTVKPRVLQKFNKTDLSFPLWLESAARYYLPRAWAEAHFGPPEETCMSEGLPMSLTFKGTPYPYQEEIIRTYLESTKNGLICVPCGRGKTFMALAIAHRLGKRTLIVVDKEFLMNQWKGEIERYLEGARVGILQANKAEIGPEFDITICMIQTVCLRDFPVKTFDGYGFTIFDECHHLGAQHFSGALRKIQTPRMLGLSATPDRDDGLTKVFEYYLGKPIYQEKTREPDPTVKVRAVWFRSSDPAYTDLPTDWRGELVTARLMTQVVDCEARTALVLEHLKEMAADPRRKILVLSERRGHLERIDKLLPAAVSRGYYVGGMKQADLDRNAETCQVLLATYAMASEAMNIKALNAMIMASPRKKVEQSTGRILRTTVDKRVVEPLIVDIIDQHETYVRQWYLRQRYYKKCAYSVEHVGKEVKEQKASVIPEVCTITLSR